MDAPPGVACLDTRYPRRLLRFGQVSRACLFMTDPQLVKLTIRFGAEAVGIRLGKRTFESDPTGIRTRVFAVRGRCPWASIRTSEYLSSGVARRTAPVYSRGSLRRFRPVRTSAMQNLVY